MTYNINIVQKDTMVQNKMYNFQIRLVQFKDQRKAKSEHNS